MTINIFNYLHKNQRYKDPSIVLFYFNSALIMVALIFETANKYDSFSICPFSVIIDNYFSHTLNLCIGIC